MTAVVRAFVVTAAPDAVVGYLKDFGHTNEWDPSTRTTRRLGSGPIVVGTTWHNESRVLGVTTELTYSLVVAESDKIVFIGRNDSATSTDTITVRPVEGGTEVTYHVDLEMHGVAKLAAPVMKIELEKLGNEVTTRLTELLNSLPRFLSDPESKMEA